MNAITIGIEEEYLLVDPATRSLITRQPAGFMDRCCARVGERAMHEYMQCQVEVGTGVCQNIAQARSELSELREAVASTAEEFDLRMIAASTHPWTHWSQQEPVDLDRYRILGVEHGSIARRMAISGMHVHAGIADRNRLIELMGQVTYFMPHLLALSTSSPFWEGTDTGLKAFRPTIIGDLPRSGLPEVFDSWNDWIEMLEDLADAGLVTDASKIWWDLRPSVRHPTLEIRICDICTWREDGLTIAALYQCLLAFLNDLRERNQRWCQYRRILILENKWRAQRYGIDATMGDFGKRTSLPFAELVEELIDLLLPFAQELDCVDEVEHARTIVKRGTSADQQLRVFQNAREAGATDQDALVAVVDWLIEQSTQAGISSVAPA